MSRTQFLTLTKDDYHDVDFALQCVADDWFDGGSSALGKFRRQKPARVDKVLKEAQAALACIVDDATRQREAPRLQALIDYAQVETVRRTAEFKLDQAVRAAVAAGAEPWTISRIVDTAEREARNV